MFLLLILPILVGGFIVCNRNPNYFYRLHRYEGQYLYLKSAHLGLTSLIIFSILALLLNKYAPASISIGKRVIPLDIIAFVKSLLANVGLPGRDLTHLSWVVIISIGSILYAYFWSFIAKLLLRFKGGTLDKSKILLMSTILNDSPLDKLFFESYIYTRPLLLSLASRKVYVGTIASLGEPNESEGMDQEISIIPLMSGYRDENNLNITFTTDYDVIDTDLQTIIRQEQILSASWFDFDVYDKLNPKKTSVGYIRKKLQERKMLRDARGKAAHKTLRVFSSIPY